VKFKDVFKNLFKKSIETIFPNRPSISLAATDVYNGPNRLRFFVIVGYGLPAPTEEFLKDVMGIMRIYYNIKTIEKIEEGNVGGESR